MAIDPNFACPGLQLLMDFNQLDFIIKFVQQFIDAIHAPR